MKKEHESINFDDKCGRIIITRQEYLDVGEVRDLDDVKNKLKMELRKIIQQVKELKKRAEEIKSILIKLDGKAGSINPAPDSAESQSSPAE